MNEPAGWQWIEAWRNGTISKEEFTALQNLLREDSDARRTLRRYMAMETALHDRAETRVLLSQSQPANDTAPLLLVTAPDSRFLTRTVVGWSTAAVCVLVAGLVWFTSPTARPKRPLMVETEPQIDGDRESGRRTTAVVSTIAQQRAHLLASAPDVLHLQLVSDEGGYVAQETGGDIVWSSARQLGFLRLRGLIGDVPTQRQYHIWIVGSDISGNELINGGIFPLNPSTGEVILPIQANQFVQQPKMFVVSVEPSGGGAALTAPLLARADTAGP
jgi:hypothetical protein